MLINNRSFPYPILNKTKHYSTYKDVDFNMEYTIQQVKNDIILKDLHFSTNSNLLKELYNQNKIGVKVVVECSSTIVREVYDIYLDNSIELKLPAKKFDGDVYLSSYAYAKEDFVLESNDEFIEDYQGINYNIEKYYILAIDSGIKVNFEHTTEEDSVIKSIFTIIPDDNLEKNFNIDCNGKKIIITLPRLIHAKYYEMANIETYQELFFMIFLIPSLVYAFDELKKEIIEDYTIEDLAISHLWFKSVVKAFNNIKGYNMTIEEFKETSSIVLAQELLGNPLDNCIQTLIMGTRPSGDDDNE